MERRALLPQLHAFRRSASPAERNIIDFIQRDPQAAVAKSVRALAAETFTSPSTVARFVRRFGFPGYREFQRELVYELSPLYEGADAPACGPGQSGGAEAALGTALRAALRSVRATEALLDPALLARCAGLIRGSRVVDLFAVGPSWLVARDLEARLFSAGVECHLDGDARTQLRRARAMRTGDVALAISRSGRTEEVLACARAARGRGAAVAAITCAGNEGSLSELADCLLQTAPPEPSDAPPDPSAVSPGLPAAHPVPGICLSQLLVVDALCAVYGEGADRPAAQVIPFDRLRTRGCGGAANGMAQAV